MMFLCIATLLCIAVTTPPLINAGGLTSKLLIHIPKAFSRREGYDHRDALFGSPPYGGSIQQNLYYADSDLCNPNVDTHKGYPDRPTGSNGQMEPWPAPYILMVDRGSCSFVTKVRNAQRSGAAAAIIADNTCLCSRVPNCTASSDAQDCEFAEPIMADDGSGADISIPSFLMFKEDADLVKDAVKKNLMVRVEMAWTVPNAGDNVEYDLWTTPSDSLSRDFLLQFKEAATSLKGHAKFTPHMYIYDGIKSGCQGNDGENTCYTLCTNKGRYCATDPDDDLDAGISGGDVVQESLRRVCIWNYYGVDDGVGEKWWNYVSMFIELCSSPTYFMNEACVEDVYKRVGINADIIKSCMRDSGGLISGKNSLLDGEINAKDERGVVVIPTVYVNKVVLRGALRVDNVFGAICSGFAAGTAPSICQECVSCSNQQQCIKDGGVCRLQPSQEARVGSEPSHTIFFSLLLVTGVFVGMGVWHYKRTREDMRDQVRGILAEYMPLEDHDVGRSPMDFAGRGASASLIG